MGQDFAVGFDFDHTLGIDNKLERTVALELLATLAASKGISYDTAAAELAVDATIASYRHEWGNIDTAIGAFLEQFAPAGGATVDAAMTFRETVVARAPSHVQVLPGAQELLTRLDELGIPYAMLTNGWSPLQEEKARLIAFRGAVLVSERIGARKPSRAAFDVLARHLEFPLERIWFVGDDPEFDCAGARAAGANAIWFDWEGRSYAPDLPAPSAVIHELSELLPVLQGKSSAAANLGG